ncbi:molecular chaperone HtpG [candidate division KSB1 bacterium]|nr:molecular chaperone HtpG [candidate division KSB1 bacterium]RQW08448.1 MAG: molecular chaperone HtpG [candidate division KSB1 bacterium]
METTHYEFQAQVRQLLDILSHSLYTNRDVFIRELISNAADALDKVRFRSVKGESMSDPDLNFEIRIDLDEKAKTITISDTGIGMTKQELIDNIGTIARSGTSEFVKQLKADEKNVTLIGRFGVGFYSVFMAGERVDVTTKSADPNEPSWIWTSDGAGTFDIAEGPKEFKRGTSVHVRLRDNAEEYAQKWKVQSIIEKYSNFVPFPIKLNGEQVNKVTALWREPKSKISKEQYNEFYKFIAHQSDDALTWMHFSADAPLQFHSLLFVPKTNIEFFGIESPDEGINLFVRRVLIDAHDKEILPHYLRFVRGVLESDDLPLNISRETLQDNPYMVKIKNTVVGKFLSHLHDLATKEPDIFKEFWQSHGRIFKEGYNDFPNKEKIAALFHFNSSKAARVDELISLDSYVDHMHPDQQEIYYLSGPDRKSVENNPALEIFKAKGIQVLYCYDPIDEFALPGLFDYRKKNIVSADQVDLAKLEKIPAESGDVKGKKKPTKKDEKDLDRLARRIKDILGAKVEDVKLSDRLVNSPAVLVSQGMSSQMEKMMHIYTPDMAPKPKVMEINKTHPLILSLLAIYKKDAKDHILDTVALNLFNSAALLDGTITDPQTMAADIQGIITETLSLYDKTAESDADEDSSIE